MIAYKGNAMTITAIETQKKRPNRVSVFIDGEFAFGMDASDALYYKLKEGEEITPEKHTLIMEELILSKAKDYAMGYLSFRLRTEREMRDYLTGKEFGSIVVDEVVRLLYKYNYLNDYEFAKSYVLDSFKLKKWGDLKIKYELGIKGVKPETISRAIEEAETEIDRIEIITALIERKVKNSFDQLDAKEKHKIFSYLQGRGFLYDDIEAAAAALREG